MKTNVKTVIASLVATETKSGAVVLALFKEFKTLATIKVAFINGSKDWPKNDKGEPAGEKAARDTKSGKEWNVFTVIARRFVDLKEGRPLTAEEVTAKKTANAAKKAAETKAQEKETAGMIQAAATAQLTVGRALEFLKAFALGNEVAQAALTAFEEATKAPAKKAPAKKASVTAKAKKTITA
jgi:hypothetical protein